jgi:hypothetical protein
MVRIQLIESPSQSILLAASAHVVEMGARVNDAVQAGEAMAVRPGCAEGEVFRPKRIPERFSQRGFVK